MFGWRNGAVRREGSATVEAWATLFQMMDRLRASISRGDLTLIHNEDPGASAAVSTLLGPLTNAWTPNAAAMKTAWTLFVRDISAPHTLRLMLTKRRRAAS